MTSGASYNALNYLTSDGPKSVGGLLKTTVEGGASGMAIGAPLGGLTKVAGAACFVADTQVLMGDGSSKAIQDVVVGDEVLAWNPATDQNEPYEVTKKFTHANVEMWTLATDSGNLGTTKTHPFFVKGKGWVPTEDIKPGDVIVGPKGDSVVIKISASEDLVEVFNFQVDGVQNYHVCDGEKWLRVHNTCIDPDTAALIGHTQRAIQDFDSGLIPMSAKEIANLSNPRIAVATRGTAIDRQVKAYISSDPNLQHLYLTDAGYYGPDIIDFNTGRWWDLTTAKAWAVHVRKYAAFGPGIGLLH